jgi:diadenosine tetraphosphate (Ap4A) HIT family hydrolase
MIDSCQFCNLANGVEFADIVYQTDLVCCFLDIDPIHEGHTLIVPKKHILDIEESDQATRLDIINTAALLSIALKKSYAPDGISMMQNGGYFNDVNHYHMHVFPRYKNDGFCWIDPKWPQKQLATASQVSTHLQKIIKELS